ncbi:hypothetical protein GCM10012279_08750 [Micromonospora yangpuensis]|nr:hypothetical protein GCM10012279_08750 [Micromonospora yangpuensis]
MQRQVANIYSKKIAPISAIMGRLRQPKGAQVAALGKTDRPRVDRLISAQLEEARSDPEQTSPDRIRSRWTRE